MNTITIIGLGAGDFDQLPIGVYRKLKNIKACYVRTLDHPVIEALQQEGVTFTSFDNVYIKNAGFEGVYEEIAATLLTAAKQTDVIYAVPGHPLVAEMTVQLLIEAEAQGRAKVKIEGGQSFLDPIFSALRIDPIEGFQLLDGTSMTIHDAQMQQHVLIAQVYDAFSASEVKLKLLEKYDAEHIVTIVTAAGSSAEQLVNVPLYELDHVATLNNLTTLYVPPVMDALQRAKEWRTFREVIATLRGPDGCPWDREQTHESLKKYMLEEVHEYLQAVDDQDDFAMTEELGDVLLQVFLNAQIGEDMGYFTLEDVLQEVTQKMIRRHPHVFGDSEANDVADVAAIWQEAKANEKEEQASLLDEQYRATSSLQTSYNYQKAVAKNGFTWNDVSGAWAKFEEEMNEFKAEAQDGTQATRVDELGDVLFTLVNIARFYGVTPEEAMVHANAKFARRFKHVEACARANGKTIKESTAEELEGYWQSAKQKERV